MSIKELEFLHRTLVTSLWLLNKRQGPNFGLNELVNRDFVWPVEIWTLFSLCAMVKDPFDNPNPLSSRVDCICLFWLKRCSSIKWLFLDKEKESVARKGWIIKYTKAMLKQTFLHFKWPFINYSLLRLWTWKSPFKTLVPFRRQDVIGIMTQSRMLISPIMNF